jgi:predicted nuclease of predicted toxin-antitoxin system
VKFKPDENLPVDLGADLHLAGHDADTVADDNLTGAADPIVVAAALGEGRIRLTLDKKITNLLQHPVDTHGGVVLFRPGASRRMAELLVLELAGRMTVVSERPIRTR